MEKLTAEIIKDTMIGMTSGHMAAIPNSPIIYSLFEVYKYSTNELDNNKAFIYMLVDMVEALRDAE